MTIMKQFLCLISIVLCGVMVYSSEQSFNRYNLEVYMAKRGLPHNLNAILALKNYTYDVTTLEQVFDDNKSLKAPLALLLMYCIRDNRYSSDHLCMFKESMGIMRFVWMVYYNGFLSTILQL